MTSRISPSTCPPLEEIAALIDGRLSAGDHARVVAHVAGCADCYAVLSGTVDFLEHEDEAGGEGGESIGEREPREAGARLKLLSPAGAADELPPTESILPVKAGRKPSDCRKPSDWGWMLKLAAAVLVGVGAGALLFPLLQTKEPELSIDQLLAGTPLLADTKPSGENLRMRSAGDGPSLSFEDLVVLGARVVDLRLWAREGGREDLRGLAHDVALALHDALASDAPDFDPETFDMASSATSRIELEELARKLDQQVEELLVTEAVEYRLGKWAEAGRLAALAGNSAHFAKPLPSRRYLQWLRKQVDPPGDLRLLEGSAERIESIAQLVRNEPLTEADLRKLAEQFSAFLKAYEIESARPRV